MAFKLHKKKKKLQKKTTTTNKLPLIRFTKGDVTEPATHFD